MRKTTHHQDIKKQRGRVRRLRGFIEVCFWLSIPLAAASMGSAHKYYHQARRLETENAVLRAQVHQLQERVPVRLEENVRLSAHNYVRKALKSGR